MDFEGSEELSLNGFFYELFGSVILVRRLGRPRRWVWNKYTFMNDDKDNTNASKGLANRLIAFWYKISEGADDERIPNVGFHNSMNSSTNTSTTR